MMQDIAALFGKFSSMIFDDFPSILGHFGGQDGVFWGPGGPLGGFGVPRLIFLDFWRVPGPVLGAKLGL